MSRQNDLAWAAGLFEGEGTFCNMKRRDGSYALQASLHMTDFPIVERFHTIMGFGKVRIRGVNETRLGKKEALCWYVQSFDEVSLAFQLLCPWLGERRCGQARATLGRVRTRAAA